MRSALKSAIQSGFGRVPGGPHLYRRLTRERMGTQGSHIDKLSHAWPSYVETWRRYGLELEGKEIWFHEGGWTPYPFVLMYLLTGRGGIVTMSEGEPQDRYAAKAIEFGLRQSFPGFEPPEERLDKLRALEGANASEIVSALGGRWVRADGSHPPLESSSVDLVVSGGVLEHYRPEKLKAFLARSRTILREGGWASHVFDLRDHLYHADKSIPFLNHLKFSELTYEALYGHRLGYHNRFLADELGKMIQCARFDVLAMRRRVLPAEKYADSPEDFRSALVGLDRALLAHRFRSATDEDLRTVAVQFICRAS